MPTTSYVVTGMTCGHCVHAVTEEVSALQGVENVAVDLDSGEHERDLVCGRRRRGGRGRVRPHPGLTGWTGSARTNL